jgi:hypothetical protein
MNSVAIRIVALSFLGAVYLGAWCPAYASMGSCNQSCIARWRLERKAAIANWVACKTGCSHGDAACSAQCFQEKSAALAKAKQDLNQCSGICGSQPETPCSGQCVQDKNAAFAKAKEHLRQCFRSCPGTTGSCHQSCTATWRQERETAIDNWVACETGCASQQ